MSQQTPIGLAELIEQVKHELLSQEIGSNGTVPLLSVDDVTLELQVTISKQGNAGLQIQVVQVGGSLSRQDVHTITVSLTPLLSKEERISLYKSRYPDQWPTVEKESFQATLKGNTDLNPNEMYS